MTRQTCRAGKLTDGVYVVRRVERADTVQHMVKVHTFAGRTAMIRADGYVESTSADVEVELATEAEITEYKREQDRFAVCRALTELGRRIADEALPVPVGGRGIVVSFDLADDSDLEPWSRWLSKRPQRGTSRPVIQAEAEGVEVYVYGPGTSGEFGPDLADAALAESRPPLTCSHCGQRVEFLNAVDICEPCEKHIAARALAAVETEHRDSIGAFPVVAVPQRTGWAPPSGHAAVLPPDALQHDRYNGENEG